MTKKILEFAFFRLDSTLSRCELWISSKSGTEKLASGSFHPFLAHLKVAQQQIASGASSVKLCPASPSEEGDTECQWFSKQTLERFVQFVNTPEVLERVINLNAEVNFLREIARTIANGCSSEFDELVMRPDIVKFAGCEDSNAFHQMFLNGSGEPAKQALLDSSRSARDITNKQLIEVADSRQRALERTQDIALHQAASAGFDRDSMSDLLAFANCFGAARLRDNCLKFMAFLEKRQENRFCLNEPDFEAAFLSALDLTSSEIIQDVECFTDNLEEPEIAEAQIWETSQSMQDVEFCPTANLEQMTEKKAGSSYLKPEMQSYQLTSKDFCPTGQFGQDSVWIESSNEPFSALSCSGTMPGREEWSTIVDFNKPSLAVITSSLEKELLSISSNNHPVEEKGRLFDRYRAYRDAKLQKESDAKKKERKEQLKALQEVLEKGEAEMVVRRICSQKRQNLSIEQEPRPHLDPVNRGFISQKSQDMRHTSDNSLRRSERYAHKIAASLRLHPLPARPESLNQQDSVSTAKLLKSSIMSSSQNSLQSIISSSRSMTKSLNHAMSLSGHNHSIATTKIGKSTPNKSAIACAEGSRKENTKPTSGQDSQSQQGKRIPKAAKSKTGVHKIRRTPSNAVFPLESCSLLSTNSYVQKCPSTEGKKCKASMMRGVPALAGSSELEVSHNVETFEVTKVQSRLSLQSKAYKVSLSLSVPKNAKPFLRKGRGIGPGAGPGALKLKESLVADNIKIRNELLETTDVVSSSAGIKKSPELQEQADLQPGEELKHKDCSQSSSVTACDLSAVEGDPSLINSSYEETNHLLHVNRSCSSEQLGYISEHFQGDQCGGTDSSQDFVQSNTLLIDCCTPNEASESIFLSSSSKSTSRTRYLEDEQCAMPEMSSSTYQFNPGHFTQSVPVGSPTSENVCGSSSLCDGLSADVELPTSDAILSQGSSGINNNSLTSPYAQKSLQLPKFKLLLRFGRKKQNSRNKPSEAASASIQSGAEIGSVRTGESTGSLADARIESSLTTARRSFFSLLAFRSKGTNLRLL